MRRITTLAVLTLVLFAPQAPARTVGAAPDLAVVDASLTSDPLWASGDPATRIPVIIALEGPTALDRFLARQPEMGSSPEADRDRADAFTAVADAQAPARAFVERSGAQIISTYDAAANGFQVLATRDQIARLTRTPGVERLFRAPELFPALDDAVPLIGATAVAADLGITGEGTHVAIIDTGIDYIHQSLGGSGKRTDYEGNDPNVVEMRTFPTAKVIGGYDFAGTNYGWRTGVPSPDSDPLDEHYHGTHVASTAAGLDEARFVHPGVAPGAKLVALKVFGAAGGTSLAPDAIEWCIESNMGHENDMGIQVRVDVINMSLGSPWSSGVLDFLGVLRRATEAGIVVIASAGNDGKTAFIHGAPAASPYAVAVANTYPTGERADKVEVTHGGSTEDLPAFQADESLARQLTGSGGVASQLTWVGNPCADIDEDITGFVALMPYGSCGVTQFQNVANAGARAGLFFTPGSNSIFSLGCSNCRNEVRIPFFNIRGDDGERLRALVVGGENVRAMMSGDFIGVFARDFLADTVSPSSSRGPARSGDPKPDISAPGTNIFAARNGEGNEALRLSGTSMAAPMVAGAAALLVESLRADGLATADAPLTADNGVSALDVGALLMNTAHATVWYRDSRDGIPESLARGGAGRVDAMAAVRGRTLARAGHIASLSFGIQAFSDTYNETLPFSVRNLSAEEKRYRVAAAFTRPEDEGHGVTLSPSEAEITLAAGEEQALSLNAAAVAAEMRPYAAYGAQLDPELGLAEAELDAYVTVTEVDAGGAPVPDGDVARIPVFFVPRPAAEVSMAPDPLRVDPDSGPVTVANPGGGAGRAEIFALWAEESTREPLLDRQINIDRVGVRVGADAGGERTIEIAVHTEGARLAPVDGEVWVAIDTDRDGVMDWLAYVGDSRDERGRQFVSSTGGRMPVVLRQLENSSPWTLTGTVFLGYYADVGLDARTVIVPLPARQLGFAPGTAIAFDAVVWMQGAFDDVIGGERMPAVDAVPDDGLDGDSITCSRFFAGCITLADGRLSFDETAVGFDFDRVRVDVGAADETEITLTQRDASATLGRVLALFPRNVAGPGDSAILDIVVGAPPTATPTAALPTPVPTPRDTAGDIHMPVLLRDLEAFPQP